MKVMFLKRNTPIRGNMKRLDRPAPVEAKKWDEMLHCPSCVKSSPSRSEEHN
jgi:hypothetical protein